MLCYDLSDLAKPKCLSEQVIRYNATCGCLAAGHLYLGGWLEEQKPKNTEDKEQHSEATPLPAAVQKWSRVLHYLIEGETEDTGAIGVFDVADPTKVKEVSSLPVSRPVFHIFASPRNQKLLASLDADCTAHVCSSNHTTVNGKSAFISLAKPTQPRLIKETNDSGGRASTLLTTKQESYLVCDGMAFSIHYHELCEAYSFLSPGSTLDGFPYHGDSDGTYAVLPLDYAAVVVRIRE